jgi:hypothetical protein
MVLPDGEPVATWGVDVDADGPDVVGDEEGAGLEPQAAMVTAANRDAPAVAAGRRCLCFRGNRTGFDHLIDGTSDHDGVQRPRHRSCTILGVAEADTSSRDPERSAVVGR